MTKWERFYRWLGGLGPGDHESASPLAWQWLAGTIARALMVAGFISRDPYAGAMSGWFAKMRWQWRFWRGAYADELAFRLLDPVSWWQQSRMARGTYRP